MAANVYPADREIDYDSLVKINREFLRALTRAYPATAHEINRLNAAMLAAKQNGGGEQAALHVDLPTIENHIERLFDNLERAKNVYDQDIALMTAKMKEKPSSRVINQCCEKHGVTYSEITSIRRKKSIVHARQEAMYRLYAETSLSLPQIGKALGGRDHTTALHGCRAHAARTGLPDVVSPKKPKTDTVGLPN